MPFGGRREMLALPVPTKNEGPKDYPHATQAGLVCRVFPRDSDGRVRRDYWHRWKLQVPDGAGGLREDTGREFLGRAVELEKGEKVLTVEEAVKRVADARATMRQAKQDDGGQRMTVAAAWSFYATEKQLNRAATHEKDAGNYERYYAWLGNKFLDELNYGFWSRFITKLKDGKLVGSLDEGATEPKLGPLADASRIGVINVAIALYVIAHKHRGLKGFAPDENPAREAKKLIGAPNKRRRHIPIGKLALAWRAADVFCPSGWRDQLYVYVLTGLRHALLADMQWPEIDWAGKAYVFSPHKWGTKRRGKKLPADAAPIRLPLPDMVMSILRSRFLFAPDKQGPVWYQTRPLSGKKTNAKVQGVAVMHDPRASWRLVEEVLELHFTPQDLRRTFATIGAATPDIDLFSISLLMLHSSSTLAAAAGIPAITVDYMQTEEAQEKMRKASNQIEAKVKSLLAMSDAELERIEDPTLPAMLESALSEDDSKGADSQS